MEDAAPSDSLGNNTAIADPKPTRTRGRAGGTGSELPTFEELSQYFHMPTKRACEELGVGLVVLKRACRRFGLLRWPYRKPRTAQQDVSAENSSGSEAEEGAEQQQPQPAAGHPNQSEASTPEILKPLAQRDSHAQAVCTGLQPDGSPAGALNGRWRGWAELQQQQQQPAGFRVVAGGGAGMAARDAARLASSTFSLASEMQCGARGSCMPPMDMSGTAPQLLQHPQQQHHMQLGPGYQHYSIQSLQSLPVPSLLPPPPPRMMSSPVQLHSPQANRRGTPSAAAGQPLLLPNIATDPRALWELAQQLVEVPGLAGQLAAAMAAVIQDKYAGA